MALLPRDDNPPRREGLGGAASPGFATTVALAFLLLSVTAVTPCYAQTPTAGIIYSRQPVFRIPFETDAGERRLVEVQLYVSEDQGLSWQKKDGVPPEQRYFNFQAERDGLYWFIARTVDFQGRGNPATLQGARPQLKVYVDTQPPIVSLRQSPGREGAVGVEWDLRDDNLDLSTLLLEYRMPGSAEWIPLSAEPVASGQRSWTPATNGAVEVRLRVRDLAKNEGEARIVLTPGSQGFRPSSSFPEQETASSSSRTVPGKRWVNSKNISLTYEIKDKGPSGVSAVELWFTRDGRIWQKYSEDPKDHPPYTLEVKDEGVYGFTLVVRSGVGLSEGPPRSGDPPQMWVEVDLTKPVVHWVHVDVGRGSDKGRLTITWKATDKNLGREPITLSYAKEAQGPWTQIAANLDNSGRYQWEMPPGVPYRFLVRVEATDMAGNVGVLDTPNYVIVDLAQPKGFILGVEPSRKEAAGTNNNP